MSRGIVAFAGPSLRPDAAGRWPNIAFRPPAAAGDIIALLARPPRMIALIDGVFDAAGSVRHKELLLLASAGATVVGAASMGALRAAELHGLGMVGIGRIYRAYRAGRLTGDDEVALLHAPEALGYRPLTLAMVEVRAALAEGRRRGFWTAIDARTVCSALHAVHFSERDGAAIARIASTHGVDGKVLVGLLEKPNGSPKRLDATLCLDWCVGEIRRPSTTAQPPLTCYVRDLAAERGVTLPRAGAAPYGRRP